MFRHFFYEFYNLNNWVSCRNKCNYCIPPKSRSSRHLQYEIRQNKMICYEIYTGLNRTVNRDHRCNSAYRQHSAAHAPPPTGVKSTAFKHRHLSAAEITVLEPAQPSSLEHLSINLSYLGPRWTPLTHDYRLKTIVSGPLTLAEDGLWLILLNRITLSFLRKGCWVKRMWEVPHLY